MKKQFTPIAMRCNKEQFEAIKPKLDRNGNEIFMIGKFKKNTYLVLFDHGEITNGSITIRENYIIHEIWNERIFLESCGIETEETFEITKETIIKYQMKDEFPEVFDVKLEVGKWYKNDQNAIFFTCNVNNKKPYGYGITAGKVFVEDDNFTAWSVSGIELVTEQEVFEALKNEAVRKGFVNGVYFNSVISNDIFKFNKIFFHGDNSMVWSNGGGVIFKNGTWATILKTKTKEEAEKLLNCKIID